MADLLINATDVANANRGNVSKLETVESFRESCVLMAMSALDTYLGYGALVNIATMDAEAVGTAPGTGNGFRFHTVGPAQIALTSGTTVDHANRITGTLPTGGLISYIRGWRAADMADADLLAALTAANGGTVPTDPDGTDLVEGDMAAIPEAPDVIKQALSEVTVAIAARRAPGLVGVDQSTVDLGTGTRTSSRAWRFAGDSEIRAIYEATCLPYRHIHV